jgi:HSP20 family molecular chaperone IbpA
MVQGAAVARRIQKSESDHLIVPPDEVQEHAQNLFAPVARRAYEIFESRGFVHGHDENDWSKAGSELLEPVKVKIFDLGDELLATADIVGYRPEDLKVGVETGALRICGRLPSGQAQVGESEQNVRRVEGFFLVVDLPVSVDPSSASADVKNDLLEVHLPKAMPQAPA